MKVTIVISFHRFVAVEGSTREKREDYPAGLTVTASEEDAEDWVAKGLAIAAD